MTLILHTVIWTGDYMFLHKNVVILPETQYGWRGGHPSSGGQAFGREGWWRNEPELSWDLWHPGRTDIEFSFMSSLTGLPRRRFQPLHNHKSPRRQQWKWCEWGDWDWNSSWCGCQWWPGADQKKLLEHYLSIWFIRFSSMRVQADLNVKMVVTLALQQSTGW